MIKMVVAMVVAMVRNRMSKTTLKKRRERERVAEILRGSLSFPPILVI